jgi:hypothetical protein
LAEELTFRLILRYRYQFTRVNVLGKIVRVYSLILLILLNKSVIKEGELVYTKTLRYKLV